VSKIHSHVQLAKVTYNRDQQLIWLRSSNFVVIVASLGFAMPWIKIRTARLYASATQVTVLAGAHNVITKDAQSSSAIGEEVANAFDIDVAIS
jgi:uncharacterized membrane protein YjgN (DUF898 family)